MCIRPGRTEVKVRRRNSHGSCRIRARESQLLVHMILPPTVKSRRDLQLPSIWNYIVYVQQR